MGPMVQQEKRKLHVRMRPNFEVLALNFVTGIGTGLLLFCLNRFCPWHRVCSNSPSRHGQMNEMDAQHAVAARPRMDANESTGDDGQCEAFARSMMGRRTTVWDEGAS